ncbi:MAG: ABC transporter ATP-binding protein [Acidimicrobiales bacterium]
MPGAAIAVRALGHRFASPSGALAVLDGVDLDVAAGGHVAVVGPSGAGKTTLLSVLGGLEPPQSGSVTVDGHDLAGLGSDDLADYRRTTVGFVFQHFGLLEALTAAENVELACALAGTPRRRRRERATGLLGAVGLGDRSGHRPGQLSGGERQRVALARALANQPRLVLADEPTGNLDDESAERVSALLAALPAEHGCTLVLVTHNAALAGRADTVLTLRHGRLATRPEAPVTTAPVRGAGGPVT